jgi:AcrR family transcriptional regulator
MRMARRDQNATATAATQARGNRPPGRDVREAILDATRELLNDHQFSELTVADILTAARVARGSFYFYFQSKHDVLAELVRRAVTQGHEVAQPWLGHPPDTTAALRAGIAAGASVWRANAPVLRAIVENWRTDPKLTALWLDQMQSFTDATITQVSADPHAAARLAGPGIPATASALTWLGERLYYLAACGIPPFDDEDTLITTLLHVWTSVLYGDAGPSDPAPQRLSK